MSFPIDIEAAKKTNLFKKFMQSKNKSSIVPESKPETILIHQNIPFLTPSILHSDLNTEIISKNLNSPSIQDSEEDRLVEVYCSASQKDK
jgi:hypothetical protein